MSIEDLTKEVLMKIAAYDFSFPTTISVGDGIAKNSGPTAKKMGATKVLIVADKGVINAGLTKTVEESLSKENIPFVIFDDVVPNPREADCDRGYEFAQSEHVDFLIGVGGGSSLDTAKSIATLLTHGGKVLDWCGVDLLQRDIAPLIAIPTTAGTGSEVTPFAVVTNTSTKEKVYIFDKRCTAKIALLDPSVLLNLPSPIMASCGLDAMTHAVEAYTCKVATPHTDAYALYAIEIIATHLRDAVRQPTLESCTGMMIGSTTAGIAFGFSDVAGVHCMAEALGGFYDLPHGVANAILLPTVSAYNIEFATERYARVAKALGLDTTGLSHQEAALAGVKELETLCKDVNIPAMKEIESIRPKDFPALAQASVRNVATPSNPRPLSADDYLHLFELVYSQ